MSVGFAHVVVVSVMLLAVSVLDLSPATPSQLWTAPTVTASGNSISNTGLISFSSSLNVVSRSGECSMASG